MRARWARVSTLSTRVGLPCTPRCAGRGGVIVGRASPRVRNRTSADSSLATYRCGTSATRTSTDRSPARSARAAAIRATCSPPSPTHSTASRAPTAVAASTIPSITRCGAISSSTRSLALAGITFAAVRDDQAASARGGDGGQLAGGGEAAAAPTAQAGAGHGLDQLGAAGAAGTAATGAARSARRAAAWSAGAPVVEPAREQPRARTAPSRRRSGAVVVIAAPTSTRRASVSWWRATHPDDDGGRRTASAHAGVDGPHPAGAASAPPMPSPCTSATGHSA